MKRYNMSKKTKEIMAGMKSPKRMKIDRGVKPKSFAIGRDINDVNSFFGAKKKSDAKRINNKAITENKALKRSDVSKANKHKQSSKQTNPSFIGKYKASKNNITRRVRGVFTQHKYSTSFHVGFKPKSIVTDKQHRDVEEEKKNERSSKKASFYNKFVEFNSGINKNKQGSSNEINNSWNKEELEESVVIKKNPEIYKNMHRGEHVRDVSLNQTSSIYQDSKLFINKMSNSFFNDNWKRKGYKHTIRAKKNSIFNKKKDARVYKDSLVSFTNRNASLKNNNINHKETRKKLAFSFANNIVKSEKKPKNKTPKISISNKSRQFIFKRKPLTTKFSKLKNKEFFKDTNKVTGKNQYKRQVKKVKSIKGLSKKTEDKRLRIPLTMKGINKFTFTPQESRENLYFNSKRDKKEQREEEEVREISFNEYKKGEVTDNNQVVINSPQPISSLTDSLNNQEGSSFKVSKRNSFRKINTEDVIPEENVDSKMSWTLKISKDIFKQKEDLVNSIKQHIIREDSVPITNLDYYQISKLLGEGSYGKVYMGNSLLLAEPVAIKCYEKMKIKTDTSFNRILQEIDILKDLNHRNIVKLYEIFENKKFIFLVLEYSDNSDILSRLRDKGVFHEDEFIPLLVQILSALKYIHSKSILHRDIKLDNILLTSNNVIKLCDFGVSRRMNSRKIIYEHIGTPAYLAPEIVNRQGYKGFQADIWSLGITCLISLTGFVPFKGDTIDELNFNILNKEFDFSKCKLSKRMTNILKGMLTKDYRNRISIDEIFAKLEFTDINRLSPMPDEDIDFRKVKQITKFGYSLDQVIKSVQDKESNHIYALYKILCTVEQE